MTPMQRAHNAKMVYHDYRIRDLIQDIQLKRDQYHSEFKEALSNRRWSKLPGYDGIDIGLMVAQQLLEKELKYWNERIKPKNEKRTACRD